MGRNGVRRGVAPFLLPPVAPRLLTRGLRLCRLRSAWPASRRPASKVRRRCWRRWRVDWGHERHRIRGSSRCCGRSFRHAITLCEDPAAPAEADVMCFDVPGGGPHHRERLEAVFEPARMLDGWTCQLLDTATHIAALILEIERAGPEPREPKPRGRRGAPDRIEPRDPRRARSHRARRSHRFHGAHRRWTPHWPTRMPHASGGPGARGAKPTGFDPVKRRRPVGLPHEPGTGGRDWASASRWSKSWWKPRGAP